VDDAGNLNLVVLHSIENAVGMNENNMEAGNNFIAWRPHKRFGVEP
jgi:hypothetical protein